MNTFNKYISAALCLCVVFASGCATSNRDENSATKCVASEKSCPFAKEPPKQDFSNVKALGDGTGKDTLLWPEGKLPAPHSNKPYSELVTYSAGVKNISVKSVPESSWRLFKADTAAKTGLVIICPGGGYMGLSYVKEGTEIAAALNKCKVSALVLKYRVPNNPVGALQDLQRAVRLARANAQKWNIDPEKIAVMGFSAGANLAARASANYAQETYKPIDNIDALSARPNGTILIYPAYCDKIGFQKRWSGKEKTGAQKGLNATYAIADELKIDAQTPPAFIVQTLEDKNYINASIAYALALKEAKVKADLHIFNEGAHGYGLRNEKNLVKVWPQLLCDWLKFNGYCAE